MAKAPEHIALKAKEAGISGWHVKGEERLLSELKALEGANESITPTEPTVDTPEAPKPSEAPQKANTEDLLDLMEGFTWEMAMMSIKCQGQKSKFYPHRTTIEAKLKG